MPDRPLLFGIASASSVSNILHKGQNKSLRGYPNSLRMVFQALPVISLDLPRRKRTD